MHALEHLAGVAERSFRLVARKHACNLMHARISLDLAEHPERVGVFELPVDGEWQRIPFAEACQYDLAATDEAARELYLENCARLLADALG